jgi:hypothetical protein
MHIKQKNLWPWSFQMAIHTCFNLLRYFGMDQQWFVCQEQKLHSSHTEFTQLFFYIECIAWSQSVANT